MTHGSCSLADYHTFLQAFWGFCQCMATLLNPLAWTVFPKGIWPHQLSGMGRDHSPAAPIGTGCVWVAAGGGLVALLCPWGSWPTLQLRLGRLLWLLSMATLLSGSLALLRKQLWAQLPQHSLFVALPAGQTTETWGMAALHPPVISFCFPPIKPTQNLTQATFCLRDAMPLWCIFTEPAAAVPLSHFSTKIVCSRCWGLC